MSLSLPEPDNARLPKSPLELVVCQIRFEAQPGISDGSVGLTVHEALGGPKGPYPVIEQATAAAGNLVIGPAGAAIGDTTTMNGWRYRSTEGDWIVSLMPDNVALETTAYGTWDDDFSPRLEALLNVVVEHVGPAVEQRIGLRYIDRITELGLKAIRDWTPYISPELLGAICHPDLGPAIKLAQQQLVLEVNDDVRCNLRHGPVDDAEAQTVDYLLDYDLHREGGRRFNAGDIKEAATEFNSYGLQLFQASITDELLAFFRGESK